MSALIIGLAIIGALYMGLRYYRKLGAAGRNEALRRGGAALVLLLALWLALRGQFLLSIPLGFFGYFVLWRGKPFAMPGQLTGGGATRLASVRTAFLEMTLDQATGALSGHVLAGAFTGRELGTLTRTDLAQLWRECRGGEAQSRQLLEAYLDRRWPEWRAEMPRSGAAGSGAGAGASAGGNGGGQQPAPERSRAPMTKAEAYDVLGLTAAANLEDIKSAHRNLMKRLHPDQGGSNYLAAKINEAKDILVGKRG